MRIERWWFTVPLRLRSIFRRNRVEQELDEELQFHLDHKIEEGIALGLSPREARFRALRSMGGIEQKKVEAREMRRVHALTDFLDDVQYALRSLRRAPGLSALVIATLAFGIGMTATPFSMLDALIFRPYPVPHPGNLVTLVSTTQDKSFDLFSYREYQDIRSHAQSFAGVIAHRPPQAVGFSTGPGATPEVRGGMLVSGNFFSALGVTPRLGRGFREDEDRVPAKNAVVVLAHDFWRNQFAGDPSVVGRTVRLNGADFTVVGVAPESFPGLYLFMRPDFYMPLATARLFSTDLSKNFFEDRDDRGLSVKARLKEGVSLAQARSEMAAIAKGFETDFPKLNRNRGAAVRTQFQMRTRGDDINWKFSVVFTVLALAVLLVACTNVAGLLLSRARSRMRELTVRLAIGAGRFRLVRLLLTESLILAAFGGLGGVAVGYAGIGLFQRFSIPSDLPLTVPFRMDGRVLLATLAMSLVSAVLCGLAPALQSTRTDLVSGLKAGDVDPPGRRRLWGRNALVVAQVAMSLMLLTATFLMARSFAHSVKGTLGIAKDRLLMARFDPRLVQYDEGQTERFYKLLVERVRAIPGVRAATLMQNPPLGLDAFDGIDFVPDGYQMPRDRESFTSLMDTVDPQYFETLGVPILRGRGLLASDTAEAPRVAVVNEQFAKRYWPNDEALGRRIRLSSRTGTPVEIVGVARTISYVNTTEKPRDFVYLPLAQKPAGRLVLMVRTTGDPLQWVPEIKNVVRSLDANLPVIETRTYEDLYRYHAVEGPRVAITLVGALGTVGLLLSIAGLYGLVAYNVSRRVREIGIRMAIGARTLDVLRLVMSHGLTLVATGIVIGLAMGFAVEKMMNAMLFDAGGIDVAAYLMVVPAMLLATLLAAYIPARRASLIAPTQALRYE